LDRQIDRNRFDFGSFLLLIFTMLVIGFLLANDGKQNKKSVPEKLKKSSLSSIILQTLNGIYFLESAT
jgi:hypothetical protein